MKQIFDHVRNYMICAFLLAVRATELSENNSMLFGLVSSDFFSVGIVGIALILMFLNLYDGIRRISVVRYHLLLTVVIVTPYIFLPLRVVEMTLNFRIPGPGSVISA